MQHKKYGIALISFVFINVSCANVVIANDAPIVVSFTRHTFRGISNRTPPPDSKLPNVAIQNTVLSYAMDATPAGLRIAKQFAETAYNSSAALALKTIDENPALAGQWSAIRPNLARERTFATAVSLYQGFSKTEPHKIPLVGCPAEEGVAVDAISESSVLESRCISQALIDDNKNTLEKQISEKMIVLANQILVLLGGKPIINESNFNTYISPIKLLCSQIEMSADLGPIPLNAVLKNNTITDPDINHEVVERALQFIGYDLLINANTIQEQVSTLMKINYIDALKNGSQEIIVSHDTKLNALLSNLGLLSAQSSPNDIGIYPLETITIALNSKRVAIVRTRLAIARDGSMTGNAGFKSWVFWTGSRKEWDARVTALRNKIYADQKVADCIQKTPLCQVVPVDVRY